MEVPLLSLGHNDVHDGNPRAPKVRPEVGILASAAATATVTTLPPDGTSCSPHGPPAQNKGHGIPCLEWALELQQSWEAKKQASRGWRYVAVLLSQLSLLVKVGLFVFLLVETRHLKDQVDSIQQDLKTANRKLNQTNWAVDMALSSAHNASHAVSHIQEQLAAATAKLNHTSTMLNDTTRLAQRVQISASTAKTTADAAASRVNLLKKELHATATGLSLTTSLAQKADTKIGA